MLSRNQNVTRNFKKNLENVRFAKLSKSFFFQYPNSKMGRYLILPLIAIILVNFTSGLENHIQFSVVGFKLMLERYYFKYIWSYYIPSLIFVVISWISFVIPPEAIPGRMAMLITLLLLFINLFGQIIRNQPAS